MCLYLKKKKITAMAFYLVVLLKLKTALLITQRCVFGFLFFFFLCRVEGVFQKIYALDGVNS